MLLQTVTHPSELPVSLDSVKTFLHVAHNDDNELITELIKEAATQCEIVGRVSLLEHVYKVTHSAKRGKVRYFLPRRATLIQAVWIRYPNGVATDIEVTDNVGLSVATSCMLWKTEPSEDLKALSELEITYKAGFDEEYLDGAASNILLAIKTTVAEWYENRGTDSTKSLPTVARNIMRSYWTPVVP